MLPPRPPLGEMSGSAPRVQEISSVIKKGNIVRRCACLMALKKEMDNRADDVHLESVLRVPGGRHKSPQVGVHNCVHFTLGQHHSYALGGGLE